MSLFGNKDEEKREELMKSGKEAVDKILKEMESLRKESFALKAQVKLYQMALENTIETAAAVMAEMSGDIVALNKKNKEKKKEEK